MRRITNKEILGFLKEEGILCKVIEAENDEENLVIEEIELNTISGIINDLVRLLLEANIRMYNDEVKLLKSKIRSNEGGVYFEKLDGNILKDKHINFEKDCYFIDCTQMVISKCYFTNLKKDIESKPVITIIEQDHEKNKNRRDSQ